MEQSTLSAKQSNSSTSSPSLTTKYTVWYWPEYGKEYHTMSLLNRIVPPVTKTILIDDVSCSLHGHSNQILSVDLSCYPQWREIWFTWYPRVIQVLRQRTLFTKTEKTEKTDKTDHKGSASSSSVITTTPATHTTVSNVSKKKWSEQIRVVFYHGEHLSSREWSMFCVAPFRIDIITQSIVGMEREFLSKTRIRRMPAQFHSPTWKEAQWRTSTERMKEALKRPFSKWRQTRDLLYEWMLFHVDYQEPLYELCELLSPCSIEVQCRLMRSILSYLSILSANHTRELVKPTIRATTNQHTFYVLEKCILEIAMTYQKHVLGKEINLDMLTNASPKKQHAFFS